MNRTILSLLAVVVLLLAACASDQGDASAAADAESQAATQSEAAEESVDAEATLGAFPSVDLTGDPELAQRFPDTVGGQPLVMQTFRGDAFSQFGADPSYEALLDPLGADLRDISVAFGVSGSAEGSLTVMAFRVAGAEQADIEEQFLAGIDEAGLVGATEQRSVGGREVWSAADPSGAAPGIFIYVEDDTVYYVTGDEDLAAEIFEALP